MRRKGLLLAGAGVFLLLVEAALIVAMLPSPPQGPADRIKAGMALREVEGILGPAADTPAPAGGAMRVRVWMTPQGAVAMQFDADDCVTEWGVLRGQPPTWIAQFRA